MKEKIKSALLCCMLACLFSCSGSKHKQEPTTETDSRFDRSMIRTRQDTLTLDSLATTYLEYLKVQNFDAALDMLSELSENGTIIPLSAQSKKEQEALFKYYPVLDYMLEELLLYSETDTELRYTIKLFEKETGNDQPNTIKFQLTPRRVNGIWKLLIKGRAIAR